MVKTITSDQISYSNNTEEHKKRNLNPSVCEPSNDTIQNILNYSKALKVSNSSKTGVVLSVMN